MEHAEDTHTPVQSTPDKSTLVHKKYFGALKQKEDPDDDVMALEEADLCRKSLMDEACTLPIKS